MNSAGLKPGWRQRGPKFFLKSSAYFYITDFHLFPIRYYTVKRYKDAKIRTVKTLYYQISWKFKYVFRKSRKVYFQKFSGASGPTMVGPPTSQNIFFHSVIKYPLSAAVHFNDNSTYDPEDPDRDRLHKVRPLSDF